MADEADIASGYESADRERALARVRERARLDPGEPGECRVCGEDSPRLVRGACAPCRDRYGLD